MSTSNNGKSTWSTFSAQQTASLCGHQKRGYRNIFGLEGTFGIENEYYVHGSTEEVVGEYSTFSIHPINSQTRTHTNYLTNYNDILLGLSAARKNNVSTSHSSSLSGFQGHRGHGHC